MPNHVSHRVYFRNPAESDDEAGWDAMKALETLMSTSEGKFDFNVLIPYPKEYADADDKRRELEKAGVPWKDLPKDGFNQGGYEWCVRHWGTKWNAYDVVYEYEHLYLRTAWNTPTPIWSALSRRFPAFALVVEYADEDCGRNCGILIYMKGDLVASRTDKDGLPDPDLFARAVISDQRLHEYYPYARRHWGSHIVCLCGSTRFSAAYQKANLDETLKGNIVLTIGCDMRADAALFAEMTEAERTKVKQKLDLLHLKKIELADEILVLNVGGYIGESTKKEIEHAEKNGKAVRYLEPIISALPAPADG